MKIKIYSKKEQEQFQQGGFSPLYFLENIIVPNQTHSNNIIEIKTWKENLENCDWIITPLPTSPLTGERSLKLGIKTADCAAIVFEDEKNYWIIHAGWRGAVNWIIEKMLEKFENPKIFVAPFLKKFEIQKDFCYDAIFEKFWDKFFSHPQPLPTKEGSNKIIFDFESCLKSLLWEQAIFDKRDTLEDNNFYSYRRDKTTKRNYTVIEK